MKETKEKIFEYLTKEIETHFSNEVEFAFVFGSWARSENRSDSDIDLMVVFKRKVIKSRKIEEFKRKFIKFQLGNKLIPDEKYPGEYVSIPSIKKAADGHGFIKNGDKVEIPTITSSDWSQFNEHRQWLSALAGPNIFLTGDYQKFKDTKCESFNTLILVALLARDSDIFKSDEVIRQLLEGGKEYLGFCNTPYTHEYLTTNLPMILDSLLNKKLVESLNTDGKFMTKRSAIFEKLIRLSDKNDVRLRKNFLGSTTTEKDKELLRECLEVGINFVLDDKEGVFNYYSEDRIRERFMDQIPSAGKGMDEIMTEFRSKILDGSICQSSKNYLAFPDSGNAISALAADILVGFTNQNLIATTKSAPTATFVEIQVIHWLRELIGFPNTEKFPEDAVAAGGIMTTGGTLANATALLAARCRMFPESRKRGLSSIKVNPILIVAGHTFYHYSHVASFWWLGLGEENIVYVKTFKNFRIDLDDLDKKITQYNDGEISKVVAVVSQAGDSRTTTIENFEAIASITSKHNVWLHVDACHGGVLLFSKEHRPRMRGIELADSVSMDPHKGLCIPYPSSAVLFKKLEDLLLISKSTDITIQKGSYDWGQVTPFMGSRAFDSLKLWFLIKHLGTEGIGQLVDYRYNLVSEWRDHLERSDLFVTLNDIELNSVVFSIAPEALNVRLDLATAEIGRINKLLHDEVYKEGVLCIHTFDMIDVAGRVAPKGEKLRVLGVTLGNPYTDSSDFAEHIKYLEKKLRILLERRGSIL